MRGTRRRLLANAALLAALGANAFGADAPAKRTPPAPWRGSAIELFTKGFRAHDEAEMLRASRSRVSDAVSLAYGVWVRVVEESAVGAAQPPEAAQTARAVVRLAQHGPPRADFDALVSSWASLEGEELVAERARAAASRSEDGAELASPRSPAFAFGRFLRARAAETRKDGDVEAEAAWSDAVAAARAVPWPDLTAQALDGWAALDRRRSRYASALARLHEALSIGDGALSPIRRAYVLNSRAEILKRLDRYDEGLRDARESHRLFDATGDAQRANEALGTVVRILRDARRFAEARETAERVRAAALAMKDARTAASMLGMLALAASDEGRVSTGLLLHERALAEAEPTGDSFLLAQILGNLGYLEAHLGLLDRAVEHLRRSHALHESRGDRVGALRALGRIGEAQFSAGSTEESLKTSTLTRDKAISLDQWRIAEAAWGRMGEALLAMGRLDRALTTYRELRDWSVAAGRREQAASAEERMARVLHRLGRDAEALPLVETAAALLDAQGYVLYAARAHETWGVVLDGAGRPADALVHFEKSLEVRRRAAGGFGETDSGTRQQLVRDVTDAAVTAALGLARSGDADRAATGAFQFLEASRASILSETLANRDALLAARLTPDLLEAERQSRAQVRAALAGGTADVTLAAAYRRRDDVLARIGREAWSALALLEPPRLSLDELRTGLAPGDAFVEFHVTDGMAAALVATRDRAALVELQGKGLADRVVGWLDLLSAPGSNEAALSSALYDRLVRPLEPHLAGVRRLIVSPDGALSFVPFAALRRVEGERSTRLAEAYETVLVPSATTLVLLRRDARATEKGRGIVAVGDPTPAPGADPLPASAEEARAVARLHDERARTLLLGQDATVDRVREALANVKGRLAVFHVASHGVFDAAHPRLSGLVLAGGARLDFDEVSSWHVPAALAVLSGCETARGALRTGEGLLCLPRPFFAAGCPRVVVSAWRVSDASTLTFMRRFHEGVALEGLSASAALRAAQRAAIAGSGPSSHPFHWAAFSLWGLPD